MDNLTKLTIGLVIILVCACGAIGVLLFPKSEATIAEKKDNSALSTLKLKAREAENARDYEHEDAWYLQALDEAKKSGTKTDVLEMLSRLVRERIDNHKLNQVDPFIQQALDIVKPLKGTHSYDPEMSVWMDDMADVLYSRGEHTSNDKIKTFCARRHLDIKLLTADRIDPQLMGETSLLITAYRHDGLYDEAAALGLESISCVDRIGHPDPLALSIGYYQIGGSELLGNHLDQAQKNLSASVRFRDSVSKDEGWKAIVDRLSSLVLARQGNLGSAKILCRHAMDVHLALMNGHPTWLSGWDAYGLGSMEMKSNNLKAASALFKESLTGFQSDKNPKAVVTDNNATLDSGKVMALEALAKCQQLAGEKNDAAKLLAQAKEIRARHPIWTHSKNPDPVQFYAAWGYLPYPIESIPTRSDLPL
jgi:tetratricopeptide (TPR) repeat protein